MNEIRKRRIIKKLWYAIDAAREAADDIHYADTFDREEAPKEEVAISDSIQKAAASLKEQLVKIQNLPEE